MMSSWSEVVTVALALPLCWGVVEVGGVALIGSFGADIVGV